MTRSSDRPERPRAHRASALSLGLAAALLTAMACGGGGGGPDVSTPQLACTGSAGGTDSVGMTCGSRVDSATERIDVVVVGPASGTTTSMGFNFDVTYDASKVQFMGSSAVSDLIPNGLVAVSLSNGQQGRLIVSVQQPGNLAPVSVGPGQFTLLTLDFQTVSGAKFGPTPLAFDNADATSASSPVTFASTLELAFQ